jgi:photosystem II stability/assembly factor-like uncharacterized protein
MIDKDPLEARLSRYLEEHDRNQQIAALENRILRAVREEPAQTPALSFPRQLLAAAAVAVVGIGLAGSVAYLRAHPQPAQGPGPVQRTTALSIGTQGGGNWIVVRGIDSGSPTRLSQPTQNALYQTSDGGLSWQDRLHFDGIYEGMSWSNNGRIGVIWAFQGTMPCGPTARSCTIAPSRIYSFSSTSDGGAHWAQHPDQVFGMFADVYFNGADGWVLTQLDRVGQPVNAPTLFRTNDAGATWSKVADLPQLSGMALSGGIWGHTSGVGETNFEFADASRGWLATGLEGTGGSGGLLETTDGGRTWHDVTVQVPAAMTGEKAVLGYPVLLGNGQALLPVFFGLRTDINTFSIDHHYLYFSSNSGSSWSDPQPLRANGLEPTGNEWQNFYLDAKHWWFTTTNQRSAGEPVAQAGPGVASTTDGGKNWQVFHDKSAPTILQLSFTDPQDGWAEAITGPDNTNILLRTTDGGAHWHPVQLP